MSRPALRAAGPGPAMDRRQCNRSFVVRLGRIEQIEIIESEFMGVPKRKPSRSRQRMRRAYNSVLKLPQLSTCPQCAAPYVPHRVCPACGYYKGRQVVTVEAPA